jgi:pimeloyl-ACP methyl ester carboxylesterase
MAAAPVPLLLLPGMACDARVWDPSLVDALGERAAVTAVDVLEGRTIGEMAARVLAGAPPLFAVCGFSQGGIVGLELATLATDRVAGVAAIACSARAPTPAQQATWAALDRQAANGELDAVADALLPALVGADDRAALGPLVAAMARSVGAARLRAQLAAQRTRPDRRAALAAVRCPALVVVGAEDRSCPAELAAEVAAAIRDARLATVPGAPHLCTRTHAGAVAAQLGRWLDEVSRRAGGPPSRRPPSP